MAEIRAAVLGGGFAMAAAGYAPSAGFAARHEAARTPAARRKICAQYM